MKKIYLVFVGLLSLLSTSCVGELSGSDTTTVSLSETRLQFPKRLLYRGDQPLVIEDSILPINQNLKIATNYGDIFVPITDVAADLRLLVSVEEEAVMSDPFFCQGGNIIFKVATGNKVLISHEVWFDIIDYDERLREYDKNYHSDL